MESLIREAILAITSQNGRGRIDNRGLIQQVHQAEEAAGHAFSEPIIQAVREQLIAEGVLGKERRRGGSVYRTDAVNHLAGYRVRALRAGGQRCIAVKGIDERGNELMAVREPPSS